MNPLADSDAPVCATVRSATAALPETSDNTAPLSVSSDSYRADFAASNRLIGLYCAEPVFHCSARGPLSPMKVWITGKSFLCAAR